MAGGLYRCTTTAPPQVLYFRGEMDNAGSLSSRPRWKPAASCRHTPGPSRLPGRYAGTASATGHRGRGYPARPGAPAGRRGRHLYRRRVPPLRISERPDRSGGRVRRDGRPGGGAGLAGPGRSAYGAGHSAGGGGQAAPTASVDPVPRHNSCNRTPRAPSR